MIYQGNPSSWKGLDSFALKIVAIVGMTANHLSHLFYEHLPFELNCILYALGGLTFPIMAFLVAEGYSHTSNFKKYALRLLLFAIISQISYGLFLGSEGNVLFTLFLGLILIRLFDTLENRILFWGIFVLCLAIGLVLDWGVFGVIMIPLFHGLKGRYERIVIPVIIAVLGLGLPQLNGLISTSNLHYLPPLLYAFAGCSLTIPLLISYNGQRGKPLKYFFYAYYPAHIFALGLIRGIVFGEWN